MVNTVYFDPAAGGDGSSVTDDGNPTTGLAEGGHEIRFVPALAQTVAVAKKAVEAALTATNAPATQGASATSLAIGTGSKNFTIQTGKGFLPAMPVRVAYDASNYMDGTVTSYDSGTGAMVVSVSSIAGAGTYTSWTISIVGKSGADGQSQVGRYTLYVPAAAMLPRRSNGCSALTPTEISAGTPDLWTLDFDAATAEYAQFNVAMPKSWNAGTVTAEFVWAHPTAATNFDVVFGLQAVAVSNAESWGATFGTAQTVADTGGTANTQYISPETAAITVGGTPAKGDTVVFQVYRASADVADTLAVDARLIGIRLFIVTDAATDA